MPKLDTKTAALVAAAEKVLRHADDYTHKALNEAYEDLALALKAFQK